MALLEGIGKNITRAAELAGRSGRGLAGWAANHPKTVIGGAAGLAAVGQLTKAAFSPEMQEAVTGSPTAIKDTVTGYSQAVLFGNYRQRDYYNPYAASTRGGQVTGTSNYVYGQSVQGSILGEISGSKMFGGWNLGAHSSRIRGQGKSPIADGSMVFGMYNMRR